MPFSAPAQICPTRRGLKGLATVCMTLSCWSWMWQALHLAGKQKKQGCNLSTRSNTSDCLIGWSSSGEICRGFEAHDRWLDGSVLVLSNVHVAKKVRSDDVQLHCFCLLSCCACLNLDTCTQAALCYLLSHTLA